MSQTFVEALDAHGVQAHAVWRLLLSYRLGQTLSSFKKPLSGTIQFEVNGETREFFSLVLGREPKWAAGIASEIDAWITGSEDTYRALLSESDEHDGLEVVGDTTLVRALFEGLTSAKQAKSLLALRAGGME